ncbi:MAG TPA: FMN-binding protein [Elusimicrobiota bacterium]|nr:FMN-binding protein [Elusimicrobiota bacterium]
MEPRRRLHLLAALALLLAAPARARVLLSQKDALALAFPGDQKVERRTAFLTDEQLAAAEKAAGTKIDSKVWTYYVGSSSAAGTAYFESHRVRTMNEAFMVVVNPDATVRFIEILSFAEPSEYQAPKKWLDQFSGKPLNDDLMLRRGLRNITGASLTSDAVTRGVRRVLAVHQVLQAGTGQ